MNKDIDITNIVLKTERIILRNWKQTDLDDFYTYASVDGVGQMAGWQPHENKEKTEEILNRFIKGKKTFAIEYQGRVVGSLGIEKYNEKKFPEFDNLAVREIGFVLAKDCWGKGIMPEAVKEVCRYLFEDVHLDLITCGYFKWNKQSARVQEKCGFVPYKEIDYVTQSGNDEIVELNVLYKEHWKQMTGVK